MDDISRRLDQLEIDTREHTAALGDIQTILLGPLPNRDNGMRGDLKDLKTRFFSAVEEFQHKWDVERRETCLGLAECRELRAILDQRIEEDNDVSIAKIQAGAARAGAGWQATAQMIAAVMTLVGVVLIAVLK